MSSLSVGQGEQATRLSGWRIFTCEHLSTNDVGKLGYSKILKVGWFKTVIRTDECKYFPCKCVYHLYICVMQEGQLEELDISNVFCEAGPWSPCGLAGRYTTGIILSHSIYKGLFGFKISQFVPFSIKNPQNLSKIYKKGKNFISKIPETGV